MRNEKTTVEQEKNKNSQKSVKFRSDGRPSWRKKKKEESR